MFVGRKHGAQARTAAVINVLQRLVDGGSDDVVGIVMPFQVVEGAGEGSPGLCAVEGMHTVMLQLARAHRGESIVVVGYFDRAIDVPLIGGPQSDIEDSGVFINGEVPPAGDADPVSAIPVEGVLCGKPSAMTWVR